MKYGAVVVAAGLSSRMGDFKPLLPLNGKTVIENTLDGLLKANVKKIVLVLGYRGEEIEKIIYSKYNDEIKIVYNYNYSKSDMMTSVKIGLNSIRNYNYDGIFILPGDIPSIESKTYTKLQNHFEMTNSLVIFPSLNGRQKHPPLINKDIINFLINFNQDGGLRKAFLPFKEKTTYCNIDDFGCSIDIDTPKDYKNLLEYNLKI